MYTPNPAFAALLAHSLGMEKTMAATATRVAATVKQQAPVRTGAYHRSLGAGASHTADGWEGRVYSTDHFWHIIEFGSINNPAYAPLRRGLDRSGKAGR